MNRGKSVKITVLVLIVAVLVATLSGCGSGEKRQATFLLKNADEWSEAQVAEQMASDKGGVTLIENGTVECAVVYPSGASDVLKRAADFLAETLGTMSGSGVAASVSDDKTTPSKYAIFVGNTAFSADVNLSEVADDGYRLEISEQGIFVCGNTDSASANGVYDFLETSLECMYVSPERTYIPTFPTVKLATASSTVNPTVTWRKVYQYESIQNGWYERLKMNGTSYVEGENNMELYNEWGTWCHSSYSFVPPEQYFDEHPEYYALFLGKRRYQFNVFGNVFSTHLCYTNPDVYEIVKAELIKRMDANPEIKYWDISIMDTYFPVCSCSECKKVNKEAGSDMGTLLAFLNRLGEDIKDDYPDVWLSTLAYQAVQDPPKNMRCADNVCIKVCAFPGSQSYPYSTETGSKDSKEIAQQIVEWGKICNNVLVWDYVVNYTHLKLPFPNLEVQKENLEFYLENNIHCVFHQGSREPADELAEMRTYLLSRQLWDKDVDLLALAKKYIKVVYGDAAEYVERYMDLQNEALVASGADLSIYDSPKKHKNGYLSSDLTDKYLELTEQALAAAGEDEIRSVELLRANALYAKMTDASWNYSAKKAAFAEFKELAAKYDFTKSGELVEMSGFIEKTYPRQLVWIVFKYVLSILGGVCFVALVFVAIKFCPKLLEKINKKRNCTAKSAK